MEGGRRGATFAMGSVRLPVAEAAVCFQGMAPETAPTSGGLIASQGAPNASESNLVRLVCQQWANRTQSGRATFLLHTPSAVGVTPQHSEHHTPQPLSSGVWLL